MNHIAQLRICLYLSLSGMVLPIAALVLNDYSLTKWGMAFVATSVLRVLWLDRGKCLRLHGFNLALSKGCGIVLEPAGVVSEDTPCWIWLGPGPYLYVHTSFFGLLWQVATGWKKDRHLAG